MDATKLLNIMGFIRVTCEEREGLPIIHECNPCNDTEGGRVRGMLYIRPSYNLAPLIAALKAGTGAATIFEAALSAGNIYIVPETTGTYNGGEPEYGAGYGDESQRLIGRNHELSVTDPSYEGNDEFYTELEKEHWIPGWRGDKLLHIGTKPASVVATDPIEEGLETDVTWKATINWKAKDRAKIYPLGELQKYFDGCWVEEPTDSEE